MKDLLAARLRALEAEGLRRQLLTIAAREGNGSPEVVVRVGDREVRAVNLASNDYLGLAGHPAVREAAARAVQRYGVGAGAARLVTGTLDHHLALEQALARLLGEERTLLFGSGYLAHLGVIPALVGEGDLIYSDEKNHASIVDGCRLARARVRVFRHLDAAHLGSLLADDAAASGRRLVITETLFSMDGDQAPLRQICEAAAAHQAWVMVDEAHAFGIRGVSGAGLVSEQGLVGQVQLRMGTLGKAVGAYGAFVGGSAELIDYLINHARTFIYSTAISVPDAAAALAGLEVLAGAEGDQLRGRLQRASRDLRQGLLLQGWPIPRGASGPILPLHVGDPRRAVALAERLLDRGVLVRAMRYPTVARGGDRLRLVASAAHGPAHVQRALAALAAQREEGS